MRKQQKIIIVMMILSLITATVAFAQDTTTPTSPSNDVSAFYVTCENQGVVNLTGTMLAGYDVYFQLYAGPNATGAELSTLRQVQLSGTFTFSQVVPYANGATVPAGGTGSARIVVAREGNSSSIDFEFNVNDLQDGCAAPQHGDGASVDAGSGASTGAISGVTRSIFAPNNVLLNPNLNAEAQVVVGARPSDTFRSDTPGLLFAECDAYPLAIPGVIYDTDRVRVFWSWFTRTPEQLQQHIATAHYVIRVNTAPLLNGIERSEPENRTGSINNWVFYSVDLGNLRPGHYEISYDLTWSELHDDGYDTYGPGGEFVREAGTCNFDVLQNTQGVSVAHNLALVPSVYPVHNINPEY